MEGQAPELLMQQITVTQGKINYNLQELKEEAIRLAEEIQIVHVDEENIKRSKKMIAAVNKRLKDLEDRRITIKKLMMQPVEVFEKEVKEIVGIVRSAEESVRHQIKQIEEEERQEKLSLLEDLFIRRISMYSFKDLFSFDDFWNPKHLNKTTTIDSVEKEMIDFLEGIEKDLKAIAMMPDADQILSFYLEVKDLAKALTLNEQQKQKMQKIEAAKAIKKTSVDHIYSITIFDEKDLKLVIMFMDQNNIKYDKDGF